MIGYPLDSHITYDTDGTPQFDRAITSGPLRKLYKTLFNEGVMPDVSTNMQVTAGAGMNIEILPGFALCNGCQKLTESSETLTLATAHATLPRIDTVVLRLDDNDNVRSCEFAIVTGVPASNPIRPNLTREGSIYEIGLADIRVNANVTQISNSAISDTRYNNDRCGVISSISKFDTSTLDQQINQWTIEQQNEFLIWFDSVKNILDQSVAGKLQNEIDELVISVENVTVSTWASDNTYEDYPYRAIVPILGVTNEYFPNVCFDVEQATSGDYAPISESGTNVVYIWSASNETITIPSICCVKGV